jgi:hypothetical protein
LEGADAVASFTGDNAVMMQQVSKGLADVGLKKGAVALHPLGVAEVTAVRSTL